MGKIKTIPLRQRVYSLSLLSLIFFLTFGCATAPEEEEFQLKITNGYYKEIDAADSEGHYSIKFNYSVTGTECYIGGYAFTINDTIAGSCFWYKAQKIVPGKTYTIEDVLNIGGKWTTEPVISMQGDASDNTIRLNATYTLKHIN
jgi:hypothetical protein